MTAGWFVVGLIWVGFCIIGELTDVDWHADLDPGERLTPLIEDYKEKA